MKLDDEGFELIKSFEDVRYKAYRDSKGWSIGLGHYILPDEPWLLKATLSLAQVMWLFKKDCYVLEKELNRLLDKYDIKLKQNAYNSLFSCYYNCGMTRFLKVPLLFAIKSGNVEAITKAFMALDKGNPTIRLRRAAELAIFLAA